MNVKKSPVDFPSREKNMGQRVAEDQFDIDLYIFVIVQFIDNFFYKKVVSF